MWLFWKPTVWHNHLADFNLPPDFTLTNLRRSEHWRTPEIQRFWVTGLIILPFLLSLGVGLVLWFQGKPLVNIALAMTYSLIVAWVGGFISASLVAVGFAVVAAPLCGVVIGLAQGEMGGLFTVLGAIFVVSLAGNILISLKEPPLTRTFSGQIGGIVFGVLVSIFVVLIGAGIGTLLVWLMSAAPMDTKLMVYAQIIGAVMSASLVLSILKHPSYDDWRGFWLFVAILMGVMIMLWEIIIPNISHQELQIVVKAVSSGLANAILFSMLFALPYRFTQQLAGTLAAVWAGVLSSGGGYAMLMIFSTDYSPPLILATSLIALLLGLTFQGWRVALCYPFLAAWHVLLYQAETRRSGTGLLHLHAAFWDEHQYLRWYDLEKHILKLSERHPQAAQSALTQLSGGPQNWVVRVVQLEWDAQRLEQCRTVAMIAQVHRDLTAAASSEDSASAWVRTFSRLSDKMADTLRQNSHYYIRLDLSKLEEQLDGLLRELNRADETYALRLRPIASAWRQTVETHRQQLAIQKAQKIQNPYIISRVLNVNQPLFVGRSDISAQIEHFLRRPNTPPLLLYGQRRMGKTSLLLNLSRLLPSTILPLFVDFQGVASNAENAVDFFYNFSLEIQQSAKRQGHLHLPSLTMEELAPSPFTRFDQWLDKIESADTLLLMLDEFVELEGAFQQGRLEERRILGWLRHQIQHQERLKILLAGSHSFEELQHWASYLINVQTVHISYLKENEARQLILNPTDDFSLQYTSEAYQRVLTLTACHPALVQLLCYHIVELKNRQEASVRQQVQLSEVEAAVPLVFDANKFLFTEIIDNDKIDVHSREMLSFLATHGEGALVSRDELIKHCPEEFEHSLSVLLRRELIEAVGTSYRFQVELIRRFF
jgi:hypothetical protein